MQTNQSKYASREEINEFMDKVAQARLASSSTDEMPSVETSRKVIEHYNQHAMSGFDGVGYFIFNGVKVCETGRPPEKAKTMEQVLFGAK